MYLIDRKYFIKKIDFNLISIYLSVNCFYTTYIIILYIQFSYTLETFIYENNYKQINEYAIFM